MIIEAILNVLKFMITSVFSILPSIPGMPANLRLSIDSVLGVIFDNLSLLGCFVRPETIIICVPILIVIFNFDKIYKVTMWIIKKIPMLGVK